MKLSIRMKIFLPVMFLLIAFPVAAWFVFSYALDGHMNYNAKRDLGQMVKTVEELADEYSNLDVPDETNAPDAGNGRTDGLHADPEDEPCSDHHRFRKGFPAGPHHGDHSRK